MYGQVCGDITMTQVPYNLVESSIWDLHEDVASLDINYWANMALNINYHHVAY